MASQNVSKTQAKKRLLRFLGKNRLMALATSNQNKPWSATVFFAFDRKYNLIFFSRQDTKHCKHIRINPNVSAAINHEWRDTQGNIRGLQITGRVSRVSHKDFRKQYAVFEKRFPWAESFANDHVLYLIRPREIWYIDEKLFGHFYRVRVV